ncbi:hypothetical protein EON82_14975 [bacterium]|nr:MAG: hypothetical protein EON82_14975 [bacterium]
MVTHGLLAALSLAAPMFADDQANVAILAETKLMRMAGMPAMPELPAGVNLPAGVQMPGMASRNLSVQLWAPVIAPQGAFAYLAPPAGLKLGNKLDLELARPTPGKSAYSGLGVPGSENPDFTIKIYWGSSEKVQEGQPKIIRYGALTPEQKAQMRRFAQNMASADAANWTTGTWPTAKQNGTIKGDASLAGSYALTTSFTGNVTLDVPTGIDFLAPIQMSAPNLAEHPNLAEAIQFKWAALPTALGQFASAFGMEGQKTMIVWVSSKSLKEGLTSDPGFLEMAKVRELVQEGAFMAPDQTTVTMPAGIFKNADMAMLNMAAWGPGVALAKGQPLPRLQTKSTLNIMLGGKNMD